MHVGNAFSVILLERDQFRLDICHPLILLCFPRAGLHKGTDKAYAFQSNTQECNGAVIPRVCNARFQFPFWSFWEIWSPLQAVFPNISFFQLTDQLLSCLSTPGQLSALLNVTL